jgi:hypothetical protein
MKNLILICMLFSMNIFSGQVLYKNLYSNKTLLQGKGDDFSSAEKDALSSLPEGWRIDKKNSLAIQCFNFGTYSEKTKKCNKSSVNNEVLVTIPIKKVL